MIIGIRRENKNEWEKRTPLIPEDIKTLIEKYGLRAIVQPSKIRAFSDTEYSISGAELDEDLNHADLIFGVKEVPTDLVLEHKTYVYFAHVIKGQPHNMAMLKTLMDKKCNLIDYERIVDENNKRLIFFGKYAGKAGIIETLHAFGEKLKLNGISTPLERIKQPYQYNSIEEAQSEIKKIGEEIKSNGFPDSISPVVFGFTGYGNVSQGAQDIFDMLPIITVQPEELFKNYDKLKTERNHFIKIVFKEEHTVRRKTGKFDLKEYFTDPEKYESNFDQYIPYLDVLVNCILWTNKNPRLITKYYLRNNSDIKLKVIGDISCDILGGIQITNDVTDPANPCYTYFPKLDRYEEGTKRDGITVMAIDNLPCEFPKEASEEFSHVLKNFVFEIYHADFDKSFEELELAYPIKKALIVHKGKLTKEYLYINQYLKSEQK
jgi:saccharopine dehydrogenase (NAD+, L-lysine forming)